jgi:hypothetical protein
MTAAILDVCPAAPPGIVPPKGATSDLARLFALDCRPASRRQLVCHWRRDADGRLACIWEPDIVLIPNR